MVSAKKPLPKAVVPLPRRPLVDKMCDSCPFNASRGAPKICVSEADLKKFLRTAEMGEFYCHETALEDPRTVKDQNGVNPSRGVQSHFKVCRGGWEHKLARLREKHELRTAS
jgi:hypothetical protein